MDELKNTETVVEPEKSPMDSKIMAAIVVAALGIFGLTAVQQGQKTDQDNISQLPALQQQVENLNNIISQERDARADSIKEMTVRITNVADTLQKTQADVAGALDSKTLDARFESVDTRISGLNDQLSRRISLEVKDPIYAQIDAISKNLKEVDRRVHEDFVWIRNIVNSHIQNPPNAHHGPN